MVDNILEDIMKKYPDLKKKLLDENSKFKGYINIYLNEKPLDTSRGLKVKAGDEDRLLILTAISGG